MKRTVSALIFLCLAQCNAAMQAALRRAEAAHARGDHFGEAVALRDACRAEPREKEVCRAAKEAADEVIANQLRTAQGPCDTEPNACLAALEVLQPFASAEDPRLMPYFDRAGAMLADRCGRAPLDSVEDALFHVRCAEAWRQRVPTAAYAARVAEIRQRAGAWVDRAAASAPGPGVAWMHEALAGCLGGLAAYGPRIQGYRAAFEDAHAVRLQLTGISPYEPRALCAQLQRDVGPVLRCDGRAGSVLQLNVDAWVDQMTDNPTALVRTVDVLDHVERWENPDYRYAQANVRSARGRFNDAANQASLARSECETAESALSRARNCYNCYARSRQEAVCNRKRAQEDIERRNKRELNTAEQTLSDTPAYLTREVYRTVSYRQVLHRFRVPWHVRVGLAGGVPQERQGALAFESTEREGVPAAKIAYAPYSEPTQAQRREGLAEAALERATAVLNAELDRLAQARLALCPAPTEPSDCQVEATLLARKDPVAEFMADVGARLDGKTGQPWPQASCAP